MPITSDRFLDAARALVRLVADSLGADLSLQLWNGEVLPLGPGARDDIRIVIAGPAVIGRLLRSPSLMTLFELYADGGVDITGASPLDALQRWDHLAAVRLVRRLDKLAVLRAAAPFLLVRPPRSAAPGFGQRVSALFGQGRDDQAMIQFHYDVSNDFYRLFLDPRMQYSSAVFADERMGLAEAQRLKLDTICRKLRLAPGDRFFDLGCGWGGLACHAATHYGVTVHGVTLSAQQLAYAQAKVAELGLGDRVTLELRDYRSLDTPEAYDKIAQIGMFEHVGIDNHDRHYQQMRRLLRPRGLYLHQATTRRAPLDLSRFRRRTAYQAVINRFIFPGGELDHIGMTVTNLERHGFEVHDVEAMREHYQRTLTLWSQALYARFDAAVAEAGLARTRLWLLYFALFATGFARGVVCDFQTLASKRQAGPSHLPLDRGLLYAAAGAELS